MLGPRGGQEHRAVHLRRTCAGERRYRKHRQTPRPVRLAQPEEDDGRLLLGFEGDKQDGGRCLEVGVGDISSPGDNCGQELRLLGGVRTRAHVHVVRAEDHPGELRIGVGILQREPSTGQHTHATGVAGNPQTLGGALERLRPGRGNQLTGLLVTDQRREDAVCLGGVGERPPTLVAIPLLVDLRILTRQPPHHLAAPPVGALGAAGGAVLAHRGRGHQVEGPGAEAVRRTGQRADRADLHRVAGEVALERLVLVDGHLLQRAALEQLDERVAGDLVGEAGASGAEDAPLAVEQHL